MDVGGGKLHVAHLRCSHTVKGLHGCLQKGMWLVMKPLHSSCCSSLLLHGHVDWWVARPVPCPCRTVDSLAFHGRFYKKKPTVFEKGGDSGNRKGYWSDVERVQTGISTWAWKVLVQGSLPDTGAVFQASMFCTGFCLFLY